MPIADVDDAWLREFEQRVKEDTGRVGREMLDSWRSVLSRARTHCERHSYTDALDVLDEVVDRPLVLKYLRPGAHHRWLPPNPMVAIRSANATWGGATYVTPITEPFSTVHYGRVGVVAALELRSVGRILDARDAVGRERFLQYAQAHPAYRRMVTTVHSHLYATMIRDDFVRDLGLDIVAFGPDEWGQEYTKSHDLWLAVYPAPGAPLIDSALARENTRLSGQRFVVIAEEAFEKMGSSMTRHDRLLGLRMSFDKPTTAWSILIQYARGGTFRMPA